MAARARESVISDTEQQHVLKETPKRLKRVGSILSSEECFFDCF